MNSRKIPKEFENPFDNIIIEFSIKINPIFKYFNFTPNMLTIISLLFGIFSAYLIHLQFYNLAALSYLISYIFDCFDGNYARTYNMVTDFGDIFDHTGDNLKYLLLFFVFYNMKNLKLKYKIYFLCIIIIFQILKIIHLECEEKIYNKSLNKQLLNKQSLNNKSVINIFEKFCKNEKNIIYTRYFGTGTFTLILILIILSLNYLTSPKS